MIANSGKCSICGKRKGKRVCLRQNDTLICSLCCGKIRDASCAGCKHYAQAQAYQASRSSGGAPPDGHFIVEINPEVEDAVNAALALAERGKTAEARCALDKLRREHPRHHLVCYAIGTVHAVEGRNTEAIAWFDKAIAIYPYLLEAHFNRAVAYRKELDVSNMIRAYQKVVEIGDPKEPCVQEARSFIKDFSKGIRRDDGVDLETYLEAKDLFDGAFALLQARDWEQALKGFQAAAAKSNRNAPTHGNIGICYAQLGRKADALAALDRALEIDPTYEPAITNRTGVERMTEGRPQQARFASVNYSMDKLLKKRSRPSALAKLKAIFGKPIFPS